ncbi:MAG TPA: hypothetical protein PKC14_02495 [Candidatus Absconditabacterales bacterium]|nr:hypothetical protein [Candidatus Absconditabacterales bacterium]
MKKQMLRVLLLITPLFSFATFQPTSQDELVLNKVVIKLKKILASNPSKKSLYKKKIEGLAQAYQSNERIFWILTELVVRSFETASASSTPSPVSQGSSCSIFPADNARNTDISNYPVHINSDKYIASMGGSTKKVHPDFGANRDGGPFGIPFVMVDSKTPLVQVKAVRYPEESDEGKFPVPLNAPREKGGDHHVIAVDKENCMLYELYAAEVVNGTREAGSVAKFDMKTNALRPKGRTSADAAGLPIFPGLARYDEVVAGTISHALRFTASKTQKAYIAPATHFASSSTDSNLPPMGLRLRLKKSYDISRLTGQSKIIAEALKKYGMILADNGSDRYISGAPDSRRSDEDLNQLKSIPGNAFEAVETGPLEK